MAFIIFNPKEESKNIPDNPVKDGPDSAAHLKALVEKSLDDDKGFDIVSIDFDDKTALADSMVIASGSSSRHVSAMAQKLKERLSLKGYKDIKIEGLQSSDWVIVDAGDIIVHLFRPEVRAFYNIEKMWGIFQSFSTGTPGSTGVHAH